MKSWQPFLGLSQLFILGWINSDGTFAHLTSVIVHSLLLMLDADKRKGYRMINCISPD